MTTEPLRPTRLVGLALLGVAAVATVLGVVALVGGDGDGQAAPQSPPSAGGEATPSSGASGSVNPPHDATGSATGSPTTDPPQSSATAGTGTPATTTTTAPMATTGGGAGQTKPPANPATTADQPVRVYNNSKIKGLATRAGDELSAHGWDVVEVSNYSGGIIPTTTVYYRPGTAEEKSARALGTAFGMRVEERFAGIEDSSPGLIVIVTNDYRGPTGKQ